MTTIEGRNGATVIGFPAAYSCVECYHADICPACGKHVALVERKDAESFSGAEYYEHWVAEHAGKVDIGSRLKPEGGYESVIVDVSAGDGTGRVERGAAGLAYREAPDGCPLARPPREAAYDSDGNML